MARSNGLAAFAAKMAAKYGEEKVSNDPPPVIVPTGILSLDWALRVGGWQLGRIYELVGPKDSAKSLTAILGMREHRAMFPDRGVAYVNIEKTFENRWAMLNGLDCSDEARAAGTWLPLQASTSEQASDMARDAISSGLYSCLVIDSVGAMESARVMEKTAEKGADDSRRNSSIITKLTKALAGFGHEFGCTVLLVNQPRANQTGFGGDISAGPKAMQHSTTAQLKMGPSGEEGSIRLGTYFGNQEIVGRRFRASIPRMKNGTPGRQAEFFVMNRATDKFGPAGLDMTDDVVSVGIRLGAIQQGGGGQYTLPDGRKCKGKPAVGDLLRKDPDALKAIRAALTFDDPIDTLEDSA
jgi:recombination protein RecA